MKIPCFPLRIKGGKGPRFGSIRCNSDSEFPILPQNRFHFHINFIPNPLPFPHQLQCQADLVRHQIRFRATSIPTPSSFGRRHQPPVDPGVELNSSDSGVYRSPNLESLRDPYLSPSSSSSTSDLRAHSQASSDPPRSFETRSRARGRTPLTWDSER